MADEELETNELKESVEESVERAVEAEQKKQGWSGYLSLSTAIIAVFAAVASLESGANSNEAILEKNDAVLNQAKASDEWALYQAKGMRSIVLDGEGEFVVGTNPELARKVREEAARLKAEQPDLARVARSLETEVEAHDGRAARLLGRHHRFAVSVTFFQIAVALCAIAALMRKKPLWFVALAASTVGLVLFVSGFLAPV
jgi:VIT1/CCC1 family predicted Fe2+/Mn2+ transporter